MSNKNAFEKKLEAQMQQWNAEIAKLKAKAQEQEADTQLAYYKKIEELRSLQDEANQRLISVKNASNDAWDDLREGTEKAWSNMSSALESATSRFK